MIPRHYLGRPARLTFTSDFHELLSGDLLPGRPLSVAYDPRRLAAPGERYPAGHPDRPVVLHARFRDGGPMISVPLESPAGLLMAPLEEATTRAAVLTARIEVPEEADYVCLRFTGTSPDGGERVDDDHGRGFLMRFPSLDLGMPTAAISGGRRGADRGTFTVTVPARGDVERISVRYRVVNAPDRPKADFDLIRTDAAPDDEGRVPWSGSAPVPDGSSIVRFKVHYWVAGERFKEDNASTYFLAPPPPEEDVPPPPPAMLDAARRFGSTGAAASMSAAPGSGEDRLRVRAHAIWEEEGRPEGRALDHWFAAREEEALKALGEGDYAAWQDGSVVTVRAIGRLPRPGWRATLERNEGEGIAEYLLLFRAMPHGAGQDGAFSVERRFEHRGSVGQVIIHDRHGRHVVDVGPGPAVEGASADR